MKILTSLKQVAVFVRTVELGNLSAAARDLNLSPSAVSKSLSLLEERLGVLLLKRTTRSLTLTEHGKIIYERATAIMTDVETTLDTARQFGKPAGTLRLTSSVAFGSTRLPPVISAYMKLFPEVNLKVGLEDRIVNLAEEETDIALRITAGTEWNYAARKLATIRWVYCAAPAYLAEHGPIDDPRDLAGADCLVYPEMTLDGGWAFDGARTSYNVKIKARLIFNSSLALHKAALMGSGVACLPTYVASEDIRDGRLVIVAPAYRCAFVHTLYAMYFRSKYVNPVIRTFIDFIADALGDVPPWDAALQERYPQLTGLKQEG